MNRETTVYVVILSVSIILTAIVNMNQTLKIAALEDRAALIERAER